MEEDKIEGGIKISQRHVIFKKIGFKKLDYNFIQPPLGEGSEFLPSDELYLTVYKSEREKVNGNRIIFFLIDYCYSIFNNFEFLNKEYFVDQVNELKEKEIQFNNF
jgi:hypothetical protein